MARNAERDAREEERRRKQLIESGFKLFAEKGIDNVSLLSVTEDADVGVATLYNYYTNKINLVVAISAYIWKKVIEDYFDGSTGKKLSEMTAYESIEAYADILIKIFMEHPDILKFSSNYKTYIRRENVPDEVLAEHIDSLKPLSDSFHKAYEIAKEDGSIRTDIPEDELYTTTTMTMLAVAERFAEGIVWNDNNSNKIHELENVKNMILSWVKG